MHRFPRLIDSGRLHVARSGGCCPTCETNVCLIFPHDCICDCVSRLGPLQFNDNVFDIFMILLDKIAETPTGLVRMGLQTSSFTAARL